MNAAAEKKILIIAGPNGAGKTNFTTAFLPNEADCLIFVNADLIIEPPSDEPDEISTMSVGRQE